MISHCARGTATQKERQARNAGYPAAISTDHPNGGSQCGFLRTDPQSRVRDYGVLSQMIETAPLRGQAIHLRIFARTATESQGWAAIFYRVDRGGDQKPLFANRRVTSQEWLGYDFEVEVPADAIRMQFGVTLSGDGQVWVDDASLEIAHKPSHCGKTPQGLADGCQSSILFPSPS